MLPTVMKHMLASSNISCVPDDTKRFFFAKIGRQSIIDLIGIAWINL